MGTLLNNRSRLSQWLQNLRLNLHNLSLRLSQRTLLMLLRCCDSRTHRLLGKAYQTETSLYSSSLHSEELSQLLTLESQCSLSQQQQQRLNLARRIQALEDLQLASSLLTMEPLARTSWITLEDRRSKTPKPSSES